jgi:hypothetical protein
MCTGKGVAMIKTFGLGVLLGMGLLVLVSYLFITLGGMPVTTKDTLLPFERYLAKKALKVAMRKEIGRRAPLPPDETNLLAGHKCTGNSVPCVTDCPTSLLERLPKACFRHHWLCSHLARVSPTIR